MDFYISIFVYTFSAFVLYKLAESIAIEDTNSMALYGTHSKMGSNSFLLSILYFAIIAGVRYNTGVDHLSYLESYLSGDMRRMEDGFGFFTMLLSSTGLHYSIYFAILASIQISFIYLACKERRELLPYIALAIFLGPYFLEWMNGIRQTIVACLFVFILAHDSTIHTTKSLIISILWLLLATTVHRSSIILIPFLLLCRCNISLNNRIVNIIVIITCIVIGMTPLWISLFSQNAGDLLNLLGYENYTRRIDDIFNVDDFKETAFGPNRIMSLFVDLIIVWYYPRLVVFFSEDRMLKVFFLMFFFGVCAYNLFANTNHLFLRPILYLNIFKLPLVAFLLVYLRKVNSSWFSVVCVLEFSFVMIEVIKTAITGLKDYNLYHFFFMAT